MGLLFLFYVTDLMTDIAKKTHEQLKKGEAYLDKE
jgi:hypothetical protein